MSHRSRVLLLGATGTIGRATADALLADGHEVVCLVRGLPNERKTADIPSAVVQRFGDPTDPASLTRDAIRGERFDALISCMASRTGAPEDAWAIDYQAHAHALNAAREARIQHMVLLSAICVQKPKLAFQRAKLAFEAELIASGLTYSIVRPTAYFKSLSGQLDRLRRGKPFLLFGDGRLTACKPVSAHDLGIFLARCLNDATCHNRILPIGGPGPAVTPRQQGEHLFRLLGRDPRFRKVPIALMDVIITVLGALGRISPVLAEKAELARIGRYYATESMLVLDPETGLYDADATPETGTETLFDFYSRLVRGEVEDDRGDHAIF
ncbi:MAG: NAD(P)H-binding protein [Pseudomonadota bacterium]